MDQVQILVPYQVQVLVDQVQMADRAGGQGVQGEKCCYKGCQNAVWDAKAQEQLCEAHSWLRKQVREPRSLSV